MCNIKLNVCIPSGKTATHAIVFAQLITPDQQNHGLHTFIVPIRDPDTHIPYPGINVGDMGEKIALNGVDNGFMMFNNYFISRTCLLNRTADVTEDGNYITSVKNKSKRFGKNSKILYISSNSISATIL